MAIFTVTSNAVENVDIFVDVDFKAGMALMRDDNGRVVKADNSLIFQKTLSQKIGKFLGFATSDHSSAANTIIVPDVIGSSYIDSSYSFIRTENNEVLTTKRALNDNLNESLNKAYNPSENMVISRRGLAVYNQPNNIFITDQFVRVLHGDYGLDYTTQIDFNSGDLLTFGSGINAGKLVKVNVNSIAQEILIVGVVEKFISSTNLLHFRQVFYSHPFSNDSAVMVLDAGNPYSFSEPSSTLANDLSIYNNDGTLLNGVAYSTAGGGSWSFDGTNDFINAPITNFTLNNASFTAMCWVNLTLPAFGTFFHLGDNGNGITMGVGLSDTQTPGTKVIVLYPLQRWVNYTYNLGTYSNGWNFVAISVDSDKYPTVYLNNNPGIYVAHNDARTPTLNTMTIGKELSNIRHITGKLTDVRLYTRPLSASEILAYYNLTKSRYGL